MQQYCSETLGGTNHENKEYAAKRYSVELGPLKEATRSVEKITREYGGKHQRLIDIVRGFNHSIIYGRY